MSKSNFKSLDEVKVIFENCPPQDYCEIGFEFNSMWIINPFYDETGRFKVNPIEYYGKDNIDKFLNKFN